MTEAAKYARRITERINEQVRGAASYEAESTVRRQPGASHGPAVGHSMSVSTE